MAEAVDVLQEISKQVSVCVNCQLHLSRKKSVPGEGPANAEMLFIGEGPGFHENEQGRPFVGQAGKLLDELLLLAGFNRESVFITNVVKCRPPENRDPLPDELAACSVYLNKQIELINPCVIVTLGRISMAKFLPAARISAVHGHPVWLDGNLVVPMYHPAAALHQPSLKSVLVSDFVALPKAIEEARNAKLRKNIPPLTEPIDTKNTQELSDSAEQLSLF
jgi:uracil-DNA glycosylase family 4